MTFLLKRTRRTRVPINERENLALIMSSVNLVLEHYRRPFLLFLPILFGLLKAGDLSIISSKSRDNPLTIMIIKKQLETYLDRHM